uniref:C2H2-type domain-containing protein n=1 Tax=Leersia perrieri TaxID=77586 RepID=A0A0D9W7Z0_9ORYZ
MQPSPSPPRARPSPSSQQASTYKHFCRVCNKGFTCGSALGGHMRAHGVGDNDGLGGDNDDDDSDDNSLVDDALRRGRVRGGADDVWNANGASSSGATNHVYALRTNPNRITRSRQVCKNCGKEFTSWEHFLEHGKCNSGEEDDDDVDHSLQLLSPDGEDDPAPAAAWSKGKRSRRAKLIGGALDASPTASASACEAGGEEEDLAKCLVMLSESKVQQTPIAEAEQESSASASREDRTPISFIEPVAFAPYTAMLPPPPMPTPQYASTVPRGMFECKACKKVFSSHQALGGHRASHKKVKGCFAAKLDNNNNGGEPSRQAADADRDADVHSRKLNANAASDVRIRNVVDAITNGEANAGTSEAAAAELSMAITPMSPAIAALAAAPMKKKGKMHECSVCHRLFTSGQALGGHKRCHWLTSSPAEHAASVANDMVVTSCHPLAFRPMPDAPEPALGLSIAANPPPPLVSVAAAIRSQAVGGGSSFLDAPPPVYIPSAPAMPSNAAVHRNKATATTGSQNDNDHAAEDEADSGSTVKRARLSDLKDVSMAGETTPWLQVGIGSSSRGGGGGDDTDKE